MAPLNYCDYFHGDVCLRADRPSTPACCLGSWCEDTWASSPVFPAGWARTLPPVNTPALFRSWPHTWVWSEFPFMACLNLTATHANVKTSICPLAGPWAAGRRSTSTTCTTCERRCWARCRGAEARAPAKLCRFWMTTSSSRKMWTASWRSAFGGTSPTPTPIWTLRFSRS